MKIWRDLATLLRNKKVLLVEGKGVCQLSLEIDRLVVMSIKTDGISTEKYSSVTSHVATNMT